MDSGTTPWTGVQLSECTDGIASDTEYELEWHVWRAVVSEAKV